MKATHALIECDRFPCVWSEEPDRDPPPGRDFAQALIEGFSRAGASPKKSAIGDRDWEHSSWFFFIHWHGEEFQIDLEPSPHETNPPTWHFAITRLRGLLRALFGGRQGRFLVSDEILRDTGAVLQQTAGCGPIAWITEDEAVDALWGRSAEKQQ